MPMFTVTKVQIVATAAAIAQTIDREMLQAQQFKAFLDQYTDAQIISNWGFVQADVDIMRSALGDLDILRTVYQGTATQGSLKDFRAFAKQLYPYGSI